MKNNMINVYYCENCKYYTKNSSNFKRHLTSNDHINNQEKYKKSVEIKKINLYPCFECDKIYKSNDSLQHHQKRHHNDIFINKLKEDIQTLQTQFNNKLIQENKNLKKIVDDTLLIAKDSVAASKNNSMSILKYANLHMKDAEPLEKPNNETVLKVIGYKNPKNNESKNETYVKTAIHKFNHHIFHSFVGDMMIEYCKPKKTNKTNLITTDTSKLNFTIMQKITKGKKEQKEWINDKSGKKFTEFVLNPVIDAVKQTLIEFVEFKKTKELNESNLCLMAKCIELKRDIEANKFTNQILKYVAPHFHFDNLKLLSDVDNELIDDLDNDEKPVKIKTKNTV